MRNAIGALLVGLALAGCSSASSSGSHTPVTKPDPKPRAVEMLVRPVIELEEPPCDEGAPVSGTSHAPGCYDLGRVIVSPNDVASADVKYDAARRRWTVNATLTSLGTSSFAQSLREFVYQKLAIVIDGKVVSTPRATPGLDAHVLTIDGGFGEATAKRIAAGLPSSA
jgi:preprotein translocase subunit SecD